MAEVRALHAFGDYLYGVVAGGFYQITSAAGSSLLGSLGSSSGTCYIADNGTDVMVSDGSTGYMYDVSAGSFAQISDTGFPGASSVCAIDTYFIAPEPGTDRFYLGEDVDGTGVTWDALDFATAEGLSDPIVRAMDNHRELWLLGSKTTEVWYNSGNADFPFERIASAFIEFGTTAPASVVKLDNSIFWLNQFGQIMRSMGYKGKVISTRQMEGKIARYDDIDDAVAIGYVHHGHSFYQVTFPSDGEYGSTWLYDVSTGMWFEMSSFVTSGSTQQGRHRANCHAHFNKMNLVGDYSNGKIYKLDADVYTDDGETIIRQRTGYLLQNAREKVIYHSFEIEFEPGVGLQTGQGNDPQAMLRWSKNGGHSWSQWRWAGIGKAGEYTMRAIWRRLGESRNRVFQVRITDPVKVCIIGATLDAEDTEY